MTDPTALLKALPVKMTLNPRQKSVGANVISAVIAGPALVYAAVNSDSWKTKILFFGAGTFVLWANAEAIKAAWGSE